MEHFVTKQIFERLDMLKTFQTGKKKKKNMADSGSTPLPLQ